MKWRRKTLVAALLLAAAACAAWLIDPFGLRQSPPVTGDLTIYSTTDTGAFEPVINDFRKLFPNVTVRYELMDAWPLYRRFLTESAAGESKADLILSSAMDLQVKLVNDGYAAPHLSANGAALPTWARWRNEAFGVTFEPVVMVFNRALMKGRPIPHTREELLKEIRRDPDFWRNRIGTYDIEKSSVGYLLASQDMRRSGEFGILMGAFGETGVRTYENTSALLDHIERGDLAMGYNLLGSYARARADAGAPILIIYPQDYTLAVSRTAIVPKAAPHPRAAQAFLEYLLSIRGQKILSTESRLNAVRPEIEGPYSRLGLSESEIGLLRPIALGPGLLVYLDRLKRRNLLESWNGAIHQTPDSIRGAAAGDALEPAPPSMKP